MLIDIKKNDNIRTKNKFNTWYVYIDDEYVGVIIRDINENDNTMNIIKKNLDILNLDEISPVKKLLAYTSIIRCNEHITYDRIIPSYGWDSGFETIDLIKQIKDEYSINK